MTIRKTEAIEMLGGSTREVAAALGVSYQAVDKWPEVLSDKVADRVLAAWTRRNVEGLPPPFAKSVSLPQSGQEAAHG